MGKPRPEFRKEALVRAAIAEIGAVGSLDVRVSDIARRAGVSSALAHHYFGSKEMIFLAAMRAILKDFTLAVQARYQAAQSPRERIDAIVAASFDTDQFEPTVVSAWLAFYVLAQRSREAARLLAVYQRRLDSNLVFALKRLVPEPHAKRIASGVGAMIDGYYLRAANQGSGVDRNDAIRTVTEHVDLSIAAVGAASQRERRPSARRKETLQ